MPDGPTMRQGLDARGKQWWVIAGKAVDGPYDLFEHAKLAARIPVEQSNDQVVAQGQLYRYGAIFIGIASALAAHKVSTIPHERSKPKERVIRVVTLAKGEVISETEATEQVRITLSDGAYFLVTATKAGH